MGRKKGSKPSNLANIIGITFGNLKVIQLKEIRKSKSIWECECSCGNICNRTLSALRKKYNSHCGCLYKENKESKGIRYVLTYYKSNAKNKNMEFNLSNVEFKNLISANCHYCDSPPSNLYESKRGYAKILYNGIDRKDNSKGYNLENSVTCCKDCNMMKYIQSDDEFLNKIYTIYNNLYKKGLT